VARVLNYDRQKTLGFGSNTDRIAVFLKNENNKDKILYPIIEDDFPSSENQWQIIMTY